MSKKRAQVGIVIILIICVAILIGAVGFVGYHIANNNDDNSTINNSDRGRGNGNSGDLDYIGNGSGGSGDSNPDIKYNPYIFCKNEIPYQVSWIEHETDKQVQHYYLEDEEKIYHKYFRTEYPLSYDLIIYDKKTDMSEHYMTFDDTTGQQCAHKQEEGLLNHPSAVGKPLFKPMGNNICPDGIVGCDISDYPSWYEKQWGIGWYLCDQDICKFDTKQELNGIECYSSDIPYTCINEEYCINVQVTFGYMSDLDLDFSDNVFNAPSGCEEW